MKKQFFVSLCAMLMLSFCLFEAKAQEKNVYNMGDIETAPSYPGGTDAFYSFLAKTIKYPKEAFEAKKQGTVYVSFVIEKDGTLSDIKSTGKAPLGYGMEQEALRVVSLSKPWNPGQLNGKPVATQFSLPVKFALTK